MAQGAPPPTCRIYAASPHPISFVLGETDATADAAAKIQIEAQKKTEYFTGLSLQRFLGRVRPDKNISGRLELISAGSPIASIVVDSISK